MKLLLFDIDGTLLLSGGAGLRAMNRAFEYLYSVDDILDGITLSGRTDNKLIIDAYNKAGIQFSAEELIKFKKVYFNLIDDEVNAVGTKKRTMPGIDDLLPQLVDRDDIYLGLLTGNWETSGRAKLAYFDLNKYFSFGAFADDSSDRNALAPIAIQRFTQNYGFEPKAEEVYIIGDTPADVQCAKPHGVVSVAVAAASHSMDDLKAHNPDFLFENLSATNEMLNILG